VKVLPVQDILNSGQADTNDNQLSSVREGQSEGGWARFENGLWLVVYGKLLLVRSVIWLFDLLSMWPGRPTPSLAFTGPSGKVG
jgi:hypothetical protein